jgi:hypothetical protein
MFGWIFSLSLLWKKIVIMYQLFILNLIFIYYIIADLYIYIYIHVYVCCYLYEQWNKADYQFSRNYRKYVLYLAPLSQQCAHCLFQSTLLIVSYYYNSVEKYISEYRYLFAKYTQHLKTPSVKLISITWERW